MQCHPRLRWCDLFSQYFVKLFVTLFRSAIQIKLWLLLPVRLQEHVSAVQNVMQVKLLSLNQSELCVELRPRPSADLSSNELEPLKLSVSWSVDDRFRLQVPGDMIDHLNTPDHLIWQLIGSAGGRGDGRSGGGLFVGQTGGAERRPAGGDAVLRGSSWAAVWGPGPEVQVSPDQ